MNIINSDLDSQLKSALKKVELLNQHIVELEKEAFKTPSGNYSCDQMPSIFGSESFTSPKIHIEVTSDNI